MEYTTTQMIIANIVHIVCALLAFCETLGVFCKRKSIGIGTIVAYAMIIIGFSVTAFKVIKVEQLLVSPLILTLVLASRLFSERKISKIWMIMEGYNLQYASEVFAVIIIIEIVGERTLDPTIEWFLGSIMPTILSMCISFGVCIFLKRMGVSGKDRVEYRQINAKQTITLLVLGFSSIFIIFLVQCLYMHQVLGTLNTSIALYIAVAANIYLVIGVDESMSKKYYQKLNKVMEEHFRNQIDYYKSLETMSKETRAIKHDMQNHLIVIQGLIGQEKYDELNKYVERIKTSVIKSRAVIQTGNTVIDAIINEKDEVAKEKQIPMEIHISIPSNICIEVVDLCIMVANSIDNALEACEKIKDITKRYIKVNVKVVQGYFIFEIVNSMANEKLKIKDNAIVTSKLDPFNHGFGLGNIKGSVDKYGGDFQIHAEGYEFKLGITINVMEKAV